MMQRFVIISLLLVALAAADDSGGHSCELTKDAEESQSAACNSFATLAVQGFDLDRDASGLESMSYQDIQNLLTGKSSDTKKICQFVRKSVKKEKGCCPGWTGDACDTPVCDPPCANGGNCAEPGLCSCQMGFTGYRCNEQKTKLGLTMQYCYPGKACYGATASHAVDTPISKDGCCAGGGGAWGMTGGKCEVCKPKDASVMAPAKNTETATCISFGTNFLRTFDELEFQFTGDCRYTMAKLGDLWSVEMRPVDCQSQKLCRKEITVTLGGDKTIVITGRTVTINKQTVVIPRFRGISSNDIPFEDRGNFIIMRARGLTFKWDERSTFYLTIPKEIKEQGLTGLCGNYDGNAQNDMVDESGTATDDAEVFADANRADATCDGAVAVTAECSTPDLRKEAQRKCYQLRGSMFAQCRAAVDADPWYRRCVADYCAAGSDSDRSAVVCDTISMYSHLCANRGNVIEWRADHFCPVPCPDGMDFSECASPCPRTCANLNAVLHDECKNECVQGCQCRPGTFLDGGKCVKSTDCSCTYKQQSYPANSEIKMDCNKCKCTNGQWDCQKDKCDATCRMFGDLHYRTFDGSSFFYQGAAASYRLVEPLAGSTDAKSDIHISTTNAVCGIGQKALCVRGVSIKYGGIDVELAPEGKVTVNKVDKTNSLPFSTDKIYIKQATSMYLLVRGFGFKVLWDGADQLYVTLSSNYVGKVRGLCGKFNHVAGDDFETPSGSVEQNAEKFAAAYRAVADPNAPENQLSKAPCNHEASLQAKAKTVCDKLLDPVIFGDCLKLVAYEPIHTGCSADICLSGTTSSDPAFCAALHTLVKECASQNVVVPWRDDPVLKVRCPVECGAAEEYTTCASGCGGACRDLELKETACEKGECIPGCRCKEGMWRDDKGNCVAKAECTCWNKYNPSVVYNSGQTIDRAGGKCTCTAGEWVCPAANGDGASGGGGSAAGAFQMFCPKNQVYRADLDNCEKTCDNMDKMAKCKSDPTLLREGCGCPHHLVKTHDGKCVLPTKCPCKHGDSYHEVDETVKIGCAKFICHGRKWWKLQDEKCPAVCWAAGDPHYQTFDGKMYSFMGKCSYTLAEAADSSWDITAENMECGMSGATCTKSVHVRIDKTKVHFVRGKPVTINDIAVDNDDYDSAGLKILRTGLYVHLVSGKGIEVLWDRDHFLFHFCANAGTRVYVYLAQRWMSKVKGLCGNYNGNAKDDFQKRDGSVAQKANEFGNAWKHSPTCADATSNPIVGVAGPTVCGDEKLKHREAWASAQCAIITKDATFEDCRARMPAEMVQFFHGACLYDACRCNRGGDAECLCTAIANFAEECNKRGTPVHWRTEFLCRECVNCSTMQCDSGAVYQSCGAPCQQTCRNIGDEPEPYCESTHCVEGCFCPAGLVKMDGKCAAADKCPCYNDGNEFRAQAETVIDCMNWSVYGHLYEP